MAALTANNVTVTRGWQTVATPLMIKHKQLTLVLSSQGLPTAPSYDGSKLFFYNPAQSTDANRDDPADVTGTFRVLVWGY